MSNDFYTLTESFFFDWQACPVGPEANILEPSEAQCQRLWLEQPLLSLTDLQALKVVNHRGWKVSQRS